MDQNQKDGFTYIFFAVALVGLMDGNIKLWQQITLAFSTVYFFSMGIGEIFKPGIQKTMKKLKK